MKKLDLTGLRFGKLVCIEVCIKGNKRSWRCNCDCGGETILSTSQINSGRIKNCSSYWHRTSISKGDVFGKLSVKDILKGDNGRCKFICVCECGNIKNCSAKNLQRGSSTHCGCTKKLQNLGKPKGVAGFNKVFSSYKGNAKYKNLEFTLTSNDCEFLFSNNCHYCNEPPSLIAKTRKKDFIYNGIDRKYSNKGYTKENCVTCCSICNYLKGDSPYDDFINRINKIYNNLNTRIVRYE